MRNKVLNRNNSNLPNLMQKLLGERNFISRIILQQGRRELKEHCLPYPTFQVHARVQKVHANNSEWRKPNFEHPSQIKSHYNLPKPSPQQSFETEFFSTFQSKWVTLQLTKAVPSAQLPLWVVQFSDSPALKECVQASFCCLKQLRQPFLPALLLIWNLAGQTLGGHSFLLSDQCFQPIQSQLPVFLGQVCHKNAEGCLKAVQVVIHWSAGAWTEARTERGKHLISNAESDF